jgi:hypothetical protein
MSATQIINTLNALKWSYLEYVTVMHTIYANVPFIPTNANSSGGNITILTPDQVTSIGHSDNNATTPYATTFTFYPEIQAVKDNIQSITGKVSYTKNGVVTKSALNFAPLTVYSPLTYGINMTTGTDGFATFGSNTSGLTGIYLDITISYKDGTSDLFTIKATAASTY